MVMSFKHYQLFNTMCNVDHLPLCGGMTLDWRRLDTRHRLCNIPKVFVHVTIGKKSYCYI